MKKHLFFILFISPFVLFTQNMNGKIVELIDNEEIPIVGANIYWIDNSNGTISDINGDFNLENPKNIKKYIVSYVGYQNDTLSLALPLPSTSLALPIDSVHFDPRRPRLTTRTVPSGFIT